MKMTFNFGNEVKVCQLVAAESKLDDAEVFRRIFMQTGFDATNDTLVGPSFF
jgi:hypothetical protein